MFTEYTLGHTSSILIFFISEAHIKQDEKDLVDNTLW